MLRRPSTRATAGVAVAVALAGVAATPLNPTHASSASGAAGTTLHSDFNGDGFPDLAVGAPGLDDNRGSVTILYGSAAELTTAGSQSWTLPTTGVGLNSRSGDEFGLSLVAARFNAGRFADLAIGVPGRSRVVVLYGSRNGLTAHNATLLQVHGPLGAYSLAAADVNGDGAPDLIAGDPFAAAGGQGAAGDIDIVYGSSAGFGSTAQSHFSEETAGMPGVGPVTNDNFGLGVAGGDFNGDGFADVAVGVPGINFGVGATIVLYGGAGGVTTGGAQYLPAWGQEAGAAFAAADFNQDGFDDLAIGEPNAVTSFGSGLVEVHYGSAAGLQHIAYGTSQVFAQQTVGMPGPQMLENDRFGYSLVAADLNHDGYPDLAIGIPGQSAVIVLRGTSARLHVKGAQYVPGIGPHAGSLTVPTGLAVAAADFRGSGHPDLVVGEPFTDTSQTMAGVIEVHPSTVRGVTDLVQGSAPVMSGDTVGIAGGPSAPGELFGLGLAS